MAQTIITLREFKENLDRYVRQVQTGKTLIIAEDGKTIARIVPKQVFAVHSRTREIVQAGLLARTGRRLGPRPRVARTRVRRTIADWLVKDEK